MTSSEYIASLIVKVLKGEISPAEQAELEHWAAESESHRDIMTSFLEEDRLAGGILEYWVEDRIWERVDPLIGEGRVASLRRIRVVRYVAAACMLGLIGLGIYVWQVSKPMATVEQALVARQDVAAPLKSRAIITLASGKQVAIDSLSKGLLASQGRVKIVKLADGGLAYTGKDLETFFNTLTNPRGSQVVTLTLADGTKVWLNAASSIRYPAAFTRSTREVEVTGEANFEVVKNASKPFKVKVNGKEEVEVLGTSFNVNSYDDEQAIKTTLVQGSVRIWPLTVAGSSDRQQITLKPGQQAQFFVGDNTHKGQERMTVVSDVDLESVMAWKNGEFAFNRLDMAAILREVGRWYDVEIVNPGLPEQALHRTFSGIVSRSSNLGEVMKILEGANIRFRIEGKKMILLQ